MGEYDQYAEYRKYKNIANKVAFEIGTVRHGVAITIKNEEPLSFVVWTVQDGKTQSMTLLASHTTEERLKAHTKGFIQNLGLARAVPVLIMDGSGYLTLNGAVLRHENKPIEVDEEGQCDDEKLKLALLQARTEGALPSDCTAVQFNDNSLFRFDRRSTK